MKSFSVKFAGIFAVVAFALTATASAQTTAELQAMIAKLQAQIAAATSSSTAPVASSYTRDLTLGSTGADVTALQSFLESKGMLTIPTGVSKGYFGEMTRAALAKYQMSVGISPAAGYFGAITRAKVAADGGSTTPSTPSTPSTGLQGGAGSITVDSLSDYTSEEVGEGESEAPVLAFEVEADDESDIEVRSIKVEFVQGTADDSEDLADYAESVQVLFKGEVVGEADAADFSENSDVYTKSISLDDVIVEAGDTEELVIAVSAQGNLDSGDIDTDAWTVDVLDVRFGDADGVISTESVDSESLEQSFDFTDFASSADLELKISLGDEEINDARVIDIDATDDTKDVELLSAEIEAEGDSDVLVKDLSVNFDSVGYDLQNGITTVTLYVDGEEVGSEAITANTATPGTDETIEFTDIDFTIDAGDTVEVVVMADIKSIADGLVNGDTLSAQISSTERALINAEDEEGEDVATADMTGTAVADAHGLFAAGIMAKFVSADAEVDAGDPTAALDHDLATFTLVFDVTAFDSDIYVDKTAPTLAGGATESDLNLSQGSGTIVSANIDSSEADEETNGFLVEEGQTDTFTVTVVVTPTADGLFQLELGNILFATTDVDGDTIYNFNLDEYKTKAVYLNNDAA